MTNSMTAQKIIRGDEWIEIIDKNSEIEVGDLLIEPFSVPHDAVDPVNFAVSDGGSRIAMVYDLGWISNAVYDRIVGS